MTTQMECPGCRHSATSAGARPTIGNWLRRSQPAGCHQPLVLLDDLGPFEHECGCQDACHTPAKARRSTP